MKLYNANLSPYATRIRMQIRAKALENQIEIVDKPAGDAYKAMVFTGKVPALDIGEYVLPESETIAEYLEDSYPERPMRGYTVLGKAKVRLVSRLADAYFVPAFTALLAQMNPKTRDGMRVSENKAQAEDAYGKIAHVIEGPRYALENRLTLADCALVPVLFFGNMLEATFGADGPKIPGKLKDYYATITKDDEIAGKAVAEMGEALAALRGGR